jgi:very-short-patch-repair endonuclease
MGNVITKAAKDLRQKQTEAEQMLWRRIRNKQLNGIKFRRQEPLGSYIVDFVSFEKKLIIEIDGSPHNEEQINKNDKQRSLWLRGEGFKVLRFWNSEIVRDIEGALTKITNAFEL